MKENNGKKDSETTQKLIDENRMLREQLLKAEESSGAITKGNVDALVIGSEHTRKIFTSETSDKIYRNLIEKMNEGAVLLNQEGTIIYCNSYFAHLTNTPLQFVIGKKINVFIDDASKEIFEILVQQGNENPVKAEINLILDDNIAIPVLVSVNSLTLDNNAILSILLTDLSVQHKYKSELEERTRDLEKLNIELEKANEDLTSFTYISSHDLQEPLRKIQNFVRCIILEDEKNLSVAGKYYVERMAQSAKRMQALIDDLLSYSYIKSNERVLENTDLNILVEEVRKEYENSGTEKGVTIETGNLCHVNIIRFQFRQLFQNLVSNSVKFSKPGTEARVIIQSELVLGSNSGNSKMLPTGKYCHIIYTDNGIGFDAQYQEYIFDVFKRLHSNEQYEGTGIGLAICKRVVENHQGFITATGELNGGARFDIYIPDFSS